VKVEAPGTTYKELMQIIIIIIIIVMQEGKKRL